MQTDHFFMTDRLCRFRVQAIQAKMGLKSAWLMNRPPASPNHFVPPARRIWPALLPETACVWKPVYVCMVRIWMNRQALLMHLLAGRLAGRGALAGPVQAGFSGQNGHCANFRAAQNIAGLGRPLYQKCRSGQGQLSMPANRPYLLGHVTFRLACSVCRASGCDDAPAGRSCLPAIMSGQMSGAGALP